jgi:uncharacterized membrane protein
MTDHGNTTLLRSVMCLTLLLAAAAFALPWMFSYGDYAKAIEWSYGITAVWLVLSVCVLTRWRKRALWTLLGVPLAVFWPAMLFLLIIRGCGGSGCP